jgi:hypothetical protein
MHEKVRAEAGAVEPWHELASLAYADAVSQRDQLGECLLRDGAPHIAFGASERIVICDHVRRQDRPKVRHGPTLRLPCG